MSYANAEALQSAVYQAMQSNTALNALVSGQIYDGLPSGVEPELYVTLGPETVRDASDKSGAGAVHSFTVSVISASAGFAKTKSVAAVICDLLIDAELALARGRLVSLGFDRARALRIQNGAGRQIDLRFRARVDGS
jgi:hypothetical protein